MNSVVIDRYKHSDNDEAITLEQMCPQGDSIKLKFLRSDFSTRSEVYENSIILCAKQNGKLIGVAAGAEKKILLHNEPIKAIYGYDLRVHPEYRKYGTAKTLTQEVLNHFGNSDCNYTFIAAQNERALGLIKRSFGAKVVIPFVYFVIPVFKKRQIQNEVKNSNAEETYNSYLNANYGIEFICSSLKKNLVGYVSSKKLSESCGCSIWTNEKILAEQIISLPTYLRFLGKFQRLLEPIVSTPRIPRINEIMRSWFLYHLYSENQAELKDLISNVNNLAIQKKIDYLYIFTQKKSKIFSMLSKQKMKMFILPYYFLARGRSIPNANDNIYVDICDL